MCTPLSSHNIISPLAFMWKKVDHVSWVSSCDRARNVPSVIYSSVRYTSAVDKLIFYCNWIEKKLLDDWTEGVVVVSWSFLLQEVPSPKTWDNLTPSGLLKRSDRVTVINRFPKNKTTINKDFHHCLCRFVRHTSMITVMISAGGTPSPVQDKFHPNFLLDKWSKDNFIPNKFYNVLGKGQLFGYFLSQWYWPNSHGKFAKTQCITENWQQINNTISALFCN